MNFKTLFLITVLVFLYSCSKDTVQTLTLSTFNIAWLGDGIEDKIERDSIAYSNIINIINELNSDIIAVQEVENNHALIKILDTNYYNFILSENPEYQKVGFLINKKINIDSIYQLDEITLDNNRLRPAICVFFKYLNEEFAAICLHFKSTSRYDDTPEKLLNSYYTRNIQSEIISDYTKLLLSENNNLKIIVMGDLNDNPLKKSTNIKPLKTDSNLVFLTDSLKSCHNNMLRNIDHIIVSRNFFDKFKYYSVGMYNINYAYNKNEKNKISDHCPVVTYVEF